MPDETPNSENSSHKPSRQPGGQEPQFNWRGLLLFAIAFALIGYFLANFITANIYGAAGGIIVLLIWVYYSAQVFLLGAEFSKVWARRYGSQRRKD